MRKGKLSLKPQELLILKTLLECDFYLSTAQVAVIANVSWNTADKYLHKFRTQNWVENLKRGNRNYWQVYRE